MVKATNTAGVRALKVHGAIVEGHVRLCWKPVKRVKNYTVCWLDKARTWCLYDLLEDELILPRSDGFIEWIDTSPGPMGPGGTYRVEGYADPWGKRKVAESVPVVLKRAKPTRTSKTGLQGRLALRKTPARTKALIMGLRSSPHGWLLVLPEEAGTCLGKRIEMQVQSPEMTDSLLDLLEMILENLPKLAARAERAFDDETGGIETLDEDVRLARPRIWIDQEHHRAGAWTMVIEAKGSDYAWHVEFGRSRFKEIWSGD